MMNRNYRYSLFSVTAILLLVSLFSSLLVYARIDQDMRRESNRQYHEEHQRTMDQDKKYGIKNHNNMADWKDFNNGVFEPSEQPGVDGEEMGNRDASAIQMTNSADSENENDNHDGEAPDAKLQSMQGTRPGIDGYDSAMVAPFQKVTQNLGADLPFYTPIEVANYKTRLQCDVCRGLFVVLDERLRWTKRGEILGTNNAGHENDDSYRTTVDLLDKIEKNEDACEELSRQEDEDLVRFCQNSAQNFDGLCMKDVIDNCKSIRAKLQEDSKKPLGSHLRTSSMKMCDTIRMCVRRF